MNQKFTKPGSYRIRDLYPSEVKLDNQPDEKEEAIDVSSTYLRARDFFHYLNSQCAKE